MMKNIFIALLLSGCVAVNDTENQQQSIQQVAEKQMQEFYRRMQLKMESERTREIINLEKFLQQNKHLLAK